MKIKKEKTDLDLLKEIEIEKFRKRFSWWKESKCELITYDDLCIPIAWTLKPRYAKNTVCLDGKDMPIKQALEYLDSIILTSENEEEKNNAESSRSAILMMSSFYL